jgi:hypothetical protein
MGKEVLDMSTDEESDCVVICPPNGNADHEEAVSGSHDEDSPERQETPHTIDSNMDNSVQEDMPVNQDSTKLIHQQESSPPESPAKPVNAGQQVSDHTVAESCSVATDRSSGAGNHTPSAHPTSSGEKLSDKSSTSTRSMAKKVCSALSFALYQASFICSLFFHIVPWITLFHFHQNNCGTSNLFSLMTCKFHLGSVCGCGAVLCSSAKSFLLEEYFPFLVSFLL